MVMNSMCSAIANIVNVLRELQVAYGYMMQNAPTEEARRIVAMNQLTVKNSLEKLGAVYLEAAGEAMGPEEALVEVPIFGTFMEAARYAFMSELQVINMLKNLHMTIDMCYRMMLMGLLIDHQLNAMRLLYLIA